VLFLLGLLPRSSITYRAVRLRPATSGCAGLSLFAALRELQRLLACWAGACPTCGRRLPPAIVYLHVPP